jgi:SAM-dependent MidA family methyltransferase
MIGAAMLPPSLSHLDAPSAAAQAVSEALGAEIRSAIESAGGWLSFARFMELALYAPGLGYYSAGSTKFGASGDFITAPELSPLFARCLARQVGQLIADGVPDVVELGAGSGALAAGILPALAALDRLPERYLILEVSADLRERQRERLAMCAPELLERVRWLDVLPAGLEGIVIANEVLDAIPTHVVRTRAGEIDELGVSLRQDGRSFQRSFRPASGELLRVARALGLPEDDYETEINLAAPALVKTLGRMLRRGVLLLVDYGFPAREYYHPQRARGTLMCHYRHHGHSDPFALIGLQDITAHVDFTAIAAAAVDAGLRVLGYATQAHFLVNLGITDLLSETPSHDARAYGPIAAAAQRLLSPSDMGELFKVLALGRGVSQPLVGFASGDRAHTL